MSFLRPDFLWFSLLAVPVVALFILKFRRKDQVVPSVLIWERVFKRKAITSLWRRLRKFLSLLLHLLILGFLTFALSRPLFSTQKIVPRYIVLVVDNSASMQTQAPDGETFFKKSKKEILSLLPKLGSDDRVLVIEAKAQPRVIFSLERGLKDLPEIIEKLPPSHSIGNLPQALYFAISLLKPHLKGEREPLLYLFSDGGGMKDLPASEREKLRLAFYTGRTRQKKIISQVDFKGVGILPFEGALRNMATWGEKKFKEKVKTAHFKGEDFSLEMEVDPKVKWGGILGELEKIPLHYYALGAEKTENIALTAFQVRRKFVGLRDYEALVRLRNYGDKKVSYKLSFFFQPFQKKGLGPEEALFDTYSKGEEFLSEPIEIRGTLKAKEEKQLFLPLMEDPQRQDYLKRGYQFQSGFHFADRTFKKDDKIFTEKFEGGILKGVLEKVETQKDGTRVTRQDSFWADNQAYALLPRLRQYMVYWINGSDNEFLRALLANYQEVERMEISSAQYLAIPEGGKLEFLQKGVQGRKADIVIFDHCEPGVELPPGNYFFLNVDGKGVPLKSRKKEDGTPEILNYPIALQKIEKDHDLMKYVELEGLYILKCRSVAKPLPAGTEEVVSTYRSPLLLTGQDSKKRWVYLGMDPRDSVMVLKNAFIFLITNSIEWLAKAQQGDFARSLKTGDLFFAGSRNSQVWDPLGTPLKPGSGKTPFYQADLVGLYRIEGSPFLTSEDGKDWGALARKIENQKDGPSRWIFSRLSPATRGLLEKDSQDQKALQEALLGDLNRLIKEEKLWRDKAFTTLPLTGKIQKLMGEKKKDSLQLNRQLLGAAYPQELDEFWQKNHYIASNLLHDQESRLDRTSQLDLGEQKISRIFLLPKREFWSYLALLALVVLALEWLFFTRLRFF